jgi:hypothetical protein
VKREMTVIRPIWRTSIDKGMGMKKRSVVEMVVIVSQYRKILEIGLKMKSEQYEEGKRSGVLSLDSRDPGVVDTTVNTPSTTRAIRVQAGTDAAERAPGKT